MNNKELSVVLISGMCAIIAAVIGVVPYFMGNSGSAPTTIPRVEQANSPTRQNSQPTEPPNQPQPVDTPTSSSLPTPNETHFGETIDLNGLSVTVGTENYFPGCKGTLGFLITLYNTTKQPIVLGIKPSDVKLYKEDGSTMDLYMQFGPQSLQCYEGIKNIEAIDAGQTILIAVRTLTSLSEVNSVALNFESKGRVNGIHWRLVLPR